MSLSLRVSQEYQLKNVVFNLGAKMGAYVWMTTTHLPAPCIGLIQFEAKSFNDIHIAFNKDIRKRSVGQDGREDGAPVYEIVIGGWMNSKTAIRKYGMQQAFVNKRNNPDGVITRAGEFTKYWVHLSQGLIVVGKGDPSQSKEIIRWKDPHPNLEVIYIGFSSWDSPIQYRNISVIDPRDSHDLFLEKHQISQPEVLVNNIALADIIITTKSGQSFYGHRAIIACASEYLWNLFQDSSIGNLFTLQLDFDINPVVVLEALKYLYGLKITLNDTNVSALLRFSQKFQISDLQTKIEQLDLQNRETQIQNAPNFSKLLKHRILSDCIFIVEGQNFPAHKCLFAFGSETFFAMFKNSFKESKQGEVTLHDVTASAFELLLQYLYTSSINFEDVNEALSLFELAERFCIPALSSICYDFVKNHIDVENCCELLTVAQFFNAAQLHSSSAAFIESHFEEVSKTAGILTLEANLLMEIVYSDDLECREEQIFETLMKWGSEDTSRHQDLVRLLSCLRFALMDKEFLQNNVMTQKIFEEPILKEKVEQSIDMLTEVKKRESNENKVKIIEDCIVLDETSASEFNMRPRKGARFTELLFSFSGDENGVFYWIATQGKTKRWANPHKMGLVKVTCSSPLGRYTRPEVLVGRAYITTSFTMGSQTNHPHWTFDLVEYLLVCNCYTIHTDGGNSYPRTWRLLGSLDSVNWMELRNHENDQTLHAPGQQAAFVVSGKNASTPYRFFRLQMTGISSNGTNSFNVCGVEFYGKVASIQKNKE